MGMYNYVVCEYPLPDGIVWNEVFQTKCFERWLSTYTITKDGHLCKSVRDGDEWQQVKLKFTGCLNFYDFHPDGWIEIDAIFENGQLTSIRQNPESTVGDPERGKQFKTGIAELCAPGFGPIAHMERGEDGA